MFRLNRYMHIVTIVLLATIMLTGCKFSHTVENVPSYCQLHGGW